MCRLSGLSRSSLYRKPRRESEWEMNLRSALHTAALDNPFYGYRRLTPELKQRGWEVGERRIRRMMREDNLLRLRKRRTKRTTENYKKKKKQPEALPELQAFSVFLTARL